MEKVIELLRNDELATIIAKKLMRYTIIGYFAWFFYQAAGGDIDLTLLLTKDKNTFNLETIFKTILSYEIVVGLIFLFIAKVTYAVLEFVIRFFFVFLIPKKRLNEIGELKLELKNITDPNQIDLTAFIQELLNGLPKLGNFIKANLEEVGNKATAFINEPDAFTKLNDLKEETQEKMADNLDNYVDRSIIGLFILVFLFFGKMEFLDTHSTWVFLLIPLVFIYTLWNLLFIPIIRLLDKGFTMLIDMAIRYLELKRLEDK